MKDTVTAKANITVELRKKDIDDILFSAFNAGGISGWADKIIIAGEKLGGAVCEQVGLGGKVLIHDFAGGDTHELTKEKLKKGFALYLEEGCHVHVEDNHIVPGDLTADDADVIVQFALFGKELYPF